MYFENVAGEMTSAQLTCLPYGTAIGMRSMLEACAVLAAACWPAASLDGP
jgi:hypothetical protein